ncbi:MAG: sulfite exporter TauE/SafE family protein [Bacteroidales bacterium]|nr:sulfite exporter TauE/SafE family protein [Bacteroidales bacterium]
MIIDYIQNADIISFPIISILILAGFLVGVVNTFAGSGTAISYSVFMLLGISPQMANGTIRIGVVMQTLAASLSFYRNGKLDIGNAWKISIPIVLGSVLGAQIAVSINPEVFRKILIVIMLILLFLIFYKPEKWLKGNQSEKCSSPKWWHYLVYLTIGIYGGFIHIGVGIFLLAALVLMAGYDLVNANGIKVFVVFVYSPFVLVVFMLNGQVEYLIGLIASVGNLLGGITASYFAVKKGASLVRIFLVIVIVLFIIKLIYFP